MIWMFFAGALAGAVCGGTVIWFGTETKLHRVEDRFRALANSLSASDDMDRPLTAAEVQERMDDIIRQEFRPGDPIETEGNA